MKQSVIISAFLLFFCVSLLSAEQPFMTIYWGQDGHNIEPDLATVCEDDDVGIVNIAFLYIFFNVHDGNLPKINLANHCVETFHGHQLLHCPDVAADIITCQNRGIKVLLSLGGADGKYGFTGDSQAEDFAKTIWNMFLGGNSTLRPFDNAILDGVDLDIEHGSPDYYDTFVSSLRDLMGDASSDYLISAAPQCPYPDEFIGPAIAAVGDEFDYLWIQFYNNYCELDTKSFNFNQWVNGTSDNIQLFIGLPASKHAAGSGFVTIAELEKVLPSVRGDSRFQGIMLWDAGYNDAARLLSQDF